MKTVLKFLAPVLVILLISCSKETPKDVAKGFEISGVSLPAKVETATGEEVIFNVYGTGPQAGDLAVLVTDDGREYEIPLTVTADAKFGFVIPKEFYTNSYTLYIKRGEERTKIGKVQFVVSVVLDIELAEGVNVYGMILCDGTPVEGVVVSDGYEVTKTDEDGVYQLSSDKKHGYVFMSTPSGYTVRRNGSSPLFYEYLMEDVSKVERVDFTLVEDPGQDKHTMIVMGDIHLANRNNDVNQFTNFVNDINQYMDANPDQKFFGLTLGDLAWDQYWIDNNYNLTNYLKDLSKLNNLAVYNTIGNHDHEQYKTGNFNTVVTYKKIVGPTYYSYNIGQIHYISIDNIECTNSSSGSRTYNTKITDDELEWLKKDLRYVPKTTPVVISMHAPVYNDSGASRLSNSSELISALSGRVFHIMSGHTHLMYNVDKTSHYEHNAGAVCATWWWTGSQTPGIHVSQDGTPGGALLFSVDGTNFNWTYKATGKSLDHQFRTYDRNEIHLTKEKYVPNASEEGAAEFIKMVGEYANASSGNEVLINVWGYDPKWKIEVFENGKSLDVASSGGKDPLHMISYPTKRWNAGKGVTFETSTTKHMFKVKASAPNTTLTIKVTDRFGKVYTEEMKRPKNFDIDTYK